MDLFHTLVLFHIATGTVGLAAFWVPILTRKGAQPHRRWGRIACYGFLGAGALAILMALLSLFGPEERIPSVTDRTLFAGLFGWMMLYLGFLTIGFVDYGLAVVKHARDRTRLRALRYQAVMAAVVASGLWCGVFGFAIGQPLMVLVAAVGIIAMILQEVFIWRRDVPRGAHVGEHFRALIGMGISAYTAFLSVGLVRSFPEQVFNPMIWAGPSVIGVSLIVFFTLSAGRKRRTKRAPATPLAGN
ncbi:hypothetical protein Ga0102493_113028 [Erythrobacter litoralis]|uniref:DUF2306 domain-containing protein n=1 Tax=Erythrobacter litoralis TaxID=39960 RepID=A0A074NL47_9SPHN|nr:hypothetical protein [Erythrobacter litoralis]AOL24025.1 hypothetical protein Ga0102493_113028 [Erythrobacter litoralis]KEO98502.1 hypothetical protein EH32_05155 [Erythrobacter litoralis]